MKTLNWTENDRLRFEEWWAKALPRLVRAVRILNISQMDAEDAVQDAVLGVISHWEKFDSYDKFFAFAVTSARWRALDMLRVRSRQPAAESELTQEDQNSLVERRSLEDVERVIERGELLEAIKDLPERSREVVMLVALGFDSFEIGAKLGVQPSSVRSLLRHARYRLALKDQREDR